MKNKFLTLFISLLLLFTFSTSVFANDVVLTTNIDYILNNSVDDAFGEFFDASLPSSTSASNPYVIEENISGNLFKTISSDLILLDNVTVSGNLYIIANSITLKSNVDYSDAISKDGSTAINKINSAASVHGSIFAICKDFVLESGAEISGDLYVVAQNIDIQKSASVSGNIFAVSRNFSLNGRIGNSVYSTSNEFNMSYYGSIANDLSIASENVTLNSVIHKNANIVSNKLTTTDDFLLYGDLNVDSLEFNFAGEIGGNATIRSKDFKVLEDNTKCLIKGNLDYSSKDELQFKDGTVNGTVNYAAYVEKDTTSKSSNIGTYIINLLTFILYVLAIVFLFKIFAKNYAKQKRDITVKNVFAGMGIGLLSILAVVLVAILLFAINVGVTLSFTLIFAYILALFLAAPLFILDISNLVNVKLNYYLIVTLVSLAVYIISTIPGLGGLAMFLFTMTGFGRLIKFILSNRKK